MVKRGNLNNSVKTTTDTHLSTHYDKKDSTGNRRSQNCHLENKNRYLAYSKFASFPTTNLEPECQDMNTQTSRQLHQNNSHLGSHQHQGAWSSLLISSTFTAFFKAVGQIRKLVAKKYIYYIKPSRYQEESGMS